ncbi:MAG: ABC transporter ATP-binding protein [Bdellovibrio sp.]|nr:ABC transporter ATP-binding protein [Bdellovibrio sp.]
MLEGNEVTATDTEYAIVARGVHKFYGTTEALAGLDLQVKGNSIFTLLGPNGAGKTTFLKTILGLVHFQRGDIRIFGKLTSELESRAQVGYLPERFYFYPYYTVLDTIAFFMALNGVQKKNNSEMIEKTLEMVGMSTLSKRRLSTLSKGQLQRVGVASLLVGQKKLLLLDEPFSGLDPLGTKDFKDLILKLKATEGKTIFINSHGLSEMEKIADDFAIIDKGKCLAMNSMKSLLPGVTLEDFFTNIIRGKN